MPTTASRVNPAISKLAVLIGRLRTDSSDDAGLPDEGAAT